MLWLIVVALFVIALVYAAVVNAEDGFQTSAYHPLQTHPGSFDE